MTLNEPAFFSLGNSQRGLTVVAYLPAAFSVKKESKSFIFRQESGLFIAASTTGVQEHEGVGHSG